LQQIQPIYQGSAAVQLVNTLIGSHRNSVWLAQIIYMLRNALFSELEFGLSSVLIKNNPLTVNAIILLLFAQSDSIRAISNALSALITSIAQAALYKTRW
jgi:hypothetical protein